MNKLEKIHNGKSDHAPAAKSPQRAGRPSRAEAEQAVRTLIRWAGDDPDREGLVETPARVARAYEQWPRDLDAIALGLFGLSPRNLVVGLSLLRGVSHATKARWFGFGGEVPAFNLRAAMLYARYSRAKGKS